MFSPNFGRPSRDGGAIRRRPHLVGVRFFNVAAAYWCRKRQVPHILFPHGSLDPYLRRRNRPRKWIYTKLFAEREYRKASAIMSIPAKKCVWLRIGRACNRRRGATVSLPKRMWFRSVLTPAGSGAGLRRWPKIPAAVSGAAGTPPGGLFRAAQLQEGARPSGPAFAQIAGDYDDVHLVLAGPGDEDYVRKVKRWLEQGAVLERTTLTGPAFRRRPFYGIAAGGTLCAAFLHGKLRPGRLRGHGEWRARRNSDQVNIWPEVSPGEGRAGGALRCECDRAGAAPTARRSARARQMGRNGRAWWPSICLGMSSGRNDPRLRGNFSELRKAISVSRRSGGCGLKVDVPERWLRCGLRQAPVAARDQ